MKKAIISISLASMLFGLTSCSKTDDDYIQPQQAVSRDSLDWTFSFNAPSLGINLTQIHPYRVAWFENNSVVIGHCFFFKSDSCAFTVFYDWNQGVVQSSGNINGRSFIWNPIPNTINICGSAQNVPVCFTLYNANNEAKFGSCDWLP